MWVLCVAKLSRKTCAEVMFSSFWGCSFANLCMFVCGDLMFGNLADNRGRGTTLAVWVLGSALAEC